MAYMHTTNSHSSFHFLTYKTSSPHLLSSLNSILSLTHFNSHQVHAPMQQTHSYIYLLLSPSRHHQRRSTLISSPPSIRWAPFSSPFPMEAVPTPSPSPPSKPKEKHVCSSVLPLHISFRCRIHGILRMVLWFLLWCLYRLIANVRRGSLQGS
ncbi:hypothetical protein SORBI_3010G121401 [Sorghum bicolor]|uniref:Uncharacterized protein n=1 Tax=Sorghum bicolor TaxID=4558 RepID=A0A1W0VSM1_SORBI|nr:hypothetical protein SORBI_3010G121401 [Sorghum bicolor]